MLPVNCCTLLYTIKKPTTTTGMKAFHLASMEREAEFPPEGNTNSESLGVITGLMSPQTTAFKLWLKFTGSFIMILSNEWRDHMRKLSLQDVESKRSKRNSDVNLALESESVKKDTPRVSA